MNKLVKKKFNGCVDIRCFERKHCIDNKESMVITHDGKKMTLSPRALKNKIKAKSDLFKFGKNSYYLYSYEWKPDIKQ